MKKKKIETFEFLNNIINIDKNIVKSNIFYLTVYSIISYIIMVCANIFLKFNIDYFDLRSYIIVSLSVMNGKIPYISVDYVYSILSIIPMVLSVYIATLFGDIRYSLVIFQLFMILCNIITTISIYFIVLKLYNSNHIAYKAGLLYIVSLVAIYSTITRYDALPVCLLIISILLFIYKGNFADKFGKDYLISAIGFYTKVFPIITIPFFMIYEWKKKKNINFKGIIWMGLLSSILLIPFLIMGNVSSILKPYLVASGTTIASIYANTFLYAIYVLITDIIKLNISYEIISLGMTGLMISSGIGILYYIYKLKDFTYKDIILYICLSLGILIISAKFHSPQYFMWITPLLVILVIDDIKKIIIFGVFQILTFIEFPILFGNFYTNIKYVNPSGSYNWWIIFLFFMFEYSILILLLIMCNNINIKKKLLSIMES